MSTALVSPEPDDKWSALRKIAADCDECKQRERRNRRAGFMAISATLIIYVLLQFAIISNPPLLPAETSDGVKAGAFFFQLVGGRQVFGPFLVNRFAPRLRGTRDKKDHATYSKNSPTTAANRIPNAIADTQNKSIGGCSLSLFGSVIFNFQAVQDS